MSYDAAIIGTGDPDADSGAAMAYNHASAYQSLDQTNLVACADLITERAEAFAAEYNLGNNVYEDYPTMLTEIEPDIVSVCVRPASHAEIVIGCAETGIPQAIHSEKPMAETWGGARRMTTACEEAGIQLTFNHQRRFGRHWRKAKSLLDAGEIGSLERLEMSAPNLFDWGTHVIDLCNFFNDESRAEWVLAGLDCREESFAFDVQQANQDLVLWKYENGLFGLASTGEGAEFIGCRPRIIGSEGVIEVQRSGGPMLRIGQAGDWETIELSDSHQEQVNRTIEHIVTALANDVEPELSAHAAQRTTEIIFGAWESVRRRGRVEFPLDIDDNPLQAMIESGELTPS